jgi:hypothetical protein
MSQPDVSSLQTRTYALVRAEDQLDLLIQVRDMPDPRPVPGGSGYQLDPGVAGGYLDVSFSPQHVMEPAVAKLGDAMDPTPAFGNNSLLVFRVPPNSAPIPFTVAGILAALRRLELVTPDVAGAASPLEAPPARTATTVQLMAATARAGEPRATRVADASGDLGGGDVLAERARRSATRVRHAGARDAETTRTIRRSREPGQSSAEATGALSFSPTRLYLPSRLETSPPGGAMRFTHAPEPVEHDGRTELWHTRLAQLRTDGALVEVPSELTVVGTHEIASSPTSEWAKRVSDERFKNALRRSVREDLAKLTDLNFQPPELDQLMLSTLGAWLDVHGDWSSNQLALRSYQHRMVMGRDVFIRTVQAGSLYPLGHQALLVSVTERQFATVSGAPAQLVTRDMIMVRKPTRTYGNSNPQTRQWPWASVTLFTRQTPPGTIKNFAATNVPTFRTANVLEVDGMPFPFRCLGVDRGGRTTAFELPLVFVPDTYGDLTPVINAYNNTGQWPEANRTIKLAGQTLSVAEPSPDAPDAVDVIAEQVVIGTSPANVHSGNGRPLVHRIVGEVPSIQRFVPTATQLALSYAKPYVDHAFHTVDNAGQLVLKILDQNVPKLNLADGASLGGLVRPPQFPLNAVSRMAGPVGGSLTSLASGKIKIIDLLQGAVGDFKLLGVFPLLDLIGSSLELDLKTQVPALVTKAMDGISMPSLHWEVPLFSQTGTATADKPLDDNGMAIGPANGRLRPRSLPGTTQPNPAAPPKLIIDMRTELVPPPDGNPAHAIMRNRSVCRVQNVELVLGWGDMELVVLPLNHLEFVTEDGKKVDVDADLGDVEFKGVLSFVRALAALVPNKGFNDPPALDVSPNGVHSTFSLPVPAVAVGMFSMQNLTFGAALDLYFSGTAPTLALNFATRDNPFQVTVAALGGGGFLGLQLSTNRIGLAGSLEFGAALTVNLGGVIRGSVSAMGGVYFSIAGEHVLLEGYLRIRGEVSVLSLIEVSIELLVAMAYKFVLGQPDKGKLTGRAQLAVRFKLLFFFKTVRVEFERTFVGSNGDPTFAEVMAPQGWADERLPWDDYCLAFA